MISLGALARARRIFVERERPSRKSHQADLHGEAQLIAIGRRRRGSSPSLRHSARRSGSGFFRRARCRIRAARRAWRPSARRALGLSRRGNIPQAVEPAPDAGRHDQQRAARASDVSAPPSNSATTGRPSTRPKTLRFALHSVCIGPSFKSAQVVIAKQLLLIRRPGALPVGAASNDVHWSALNRGR